MKLIVCGPERSNNEIIETIIGDHEIERVDKIDTSTDADLIFYLHDNFSEVDFSNTSCPVLVNAVELTLAELSVPLNVSRINGWPGFLSRKSWEIVSPKTNSLADKFATLGKKVEFLTDEPGMVAPRIISMIVNEAYFALEQGVSTKEEIDVAMKLGTNYPLGPFEWSEKIGIDKIHSLLLKLNITDSRYAPAAAMTQELKNIEKKNHSEQN